MKKVLSNLFAILILLSACVPEVPSGNVFSSPAAEAAQSLPIETPPSPDEARAALLAQYTGQFEASEVLFADTHDNGTLFAVVLRRLPSYEIYPNYLYRRNHFTLDIARYNAERALWECMTARPILLLENTYWDDLAATRGETGEFLITHGSNPFAALRFVGEQFVLTEQGGVDTGYREIPDPGAALLLGLSGDFERSLFVYAADGKLCVSSNPGAILVPTDDGVYAISKLHHYQEIYNADFKEDDNQFRYCGQVTCRDYFAYPASADTLPLLAERTAEYGSGAFGYSSSEDTLSFVTNGYISYRNSYHWVSHGTGRSTTPCPLFGRVRDMNTERFGESGYDRMGFALSGMPLRDWLPQQYQTQIERAAESARREHEPLNALLREEDGRTWTPDVYNVSTDNLFLVHEDGALKVKLAVERWYYAPNGSPHGHYETYIDTGIVLPDEFTGGQTLCMDFAEIKMRISEAIDAFSSPNGLLLAVEMPNDIFLYIRESTDAKFNFSDPVEVISKRAGERVIMAEWAVGETIAQWKRELTQIQTSCLYWYSTGEDRFGLG